MRLIPIQDRGLVHMSKLLEIRNLKTYFFTDEGIVKAVDGVSFHVERGKTLGVVGESGCGKSVTARSILRIEGARGRIVDGEILFHRAPGDTVDLAKLHPTGPEIRSIRGKEIAMIFQEPMTALSPVHTIGNQVMEAILLHQDVTKEEARELALDILKRVGIPNPERRIDEYPHQLSGGMRQRAMIAMALSCHPKLLIADEPTTALDVTIQAQILELMKELQEELGTAIVMITHNLGDISEMADDVVVMYLGRIVESVSVEGLFYNPAHPYTKALLRSIPRVGKKVEKRLESIKDVVPDAYNIPSGCTFHPRCPEFQEGFCDVYVPELVELAPGHQVSCLLYNGRERDA